MKWITFEDAKHNEFDVPYKLDHSVLEPRKYKRVYPGIRVYGYGTIRVSRNGTRDPLWRREVHQLYGLHFPLVSELTGLKLYNPDTRETVPKNLLSAGVVYYDTMRQRIHRFGWGTGNDYMEFVSEHAQPSFFGSGVFSYKRPNIERYNARMAGLQEYITIGAALIALDKKNAPGGYYDWELRGMLLEGRMPKGGMKSESFKQACCTLAGSPGPTSHYVREGTCDVYEPKYLAVREA